MSEKDFFDYVPKEKALIETPQTSGQKEFYCHILNTFHEGFTIQDRNGKILFLNESALKILGLTQDQLVGKSFLDPAWHVVHEDGSAFLLSDCPSMKTVTFGFPQLNVVMGMIRPDLETKWLQINSVPFEVEHEKQNCAVLSTFRDVTEQFKKDKMLKSVIQNSPGMNFQFKLTPDGKMFFPFISAKGYEISELTETDLIKNPDVMLELVHEDDIEFLKAEILKSSILCEVFQWKGRIVTSKGTIKWISAKSSPRREHDGSIVWDGIVIDITKEVLLEEELAIERVKTIHSAKLASLAEMSSGMAHEINNPLTIISGISRMLNNSHYEPMKFKKGFHTINKAIERMAKIVHGLQRFSRVQVTDQKKIHSLQSILENVGDYFEVNSKVKDIPVYFNVTSKALILCDSLEIEQSVISLINNSLEAIFFMPERWIKLETFDDENNVYIKIIDSGPGIPGAVAEKLFTPFFTTKEVGKGVGLGMCISRGIILDHKGDISLIKDYHNTCFEIRLPIANS